MKSLDQFFQSEIVQALGWTILHSIWQGLLIVILLTIALVILRKHSSQIRYLIGYVALLSLALCSLGTFLFSLPSDTLAAPETVLLIEDKAIDLAAIPPAETATPLLVEQSLWQSFVQLLEANLPWITIIWMLGVLLLSLRFLAELAYIQRLKYQPGSRAVDAFQEVVNRLADDMGISRAVALKENFRIDSPMVIGFLKPVILVPIGLLSRLEPAQVESIMAHELAHIKRHDYIFNLLQSLVEILLFFNPATWWISALIRSEREYCCDEMAIAQTGNEVIFVQTLARLEEHRRLPGNMALAFNGRRNAGVLGRIQRIVNSEEPFRVPYKLFWSCLILLGSLGLFAFQTPTLPSQERSHLSQPDTLDEELAITENISSDAFGIEAVSNDTVREKNSQIPLSKQDQQQAIQSSDNITKENSQITSLRSDDRQRLVDGGASFNLENLDTVPKEVRQLKQQMMKLAKEFQQEEMAFQQQIREIKKQKLQFELEIQSAQNRSMKEQFDLEKKSQEIQLSQMLKLKELELEQNLINNKSLEMQYEMQQLEFKMSEGGQENEDELKLKRKEYQQQAIELEKKQRELELNQKRQQVAAEKDMQILQNKQWKLKEEARIAQNDKQLRVMELEQKLQEIQFQNQMIQSERQNKIQLIRMQIEEALQKWQEK